MTSTQNPYKFRATDSGYQAGDEREYDVLRRGRLIGTVGRMDLPVGETDGDFVDGWCFTSTDGKHYGEGRTRNAAVKAAIEAAQANKS